ncbi:MAG: putative metalloprotease CJM1_0395 family protein, partial [Pseudomonadota bacterium]|nr:putative metalloprotease CJM1_0395 family protein [Pseudomonadota bacterium]
MNIVTPIPTSFAIPTANLSVEAARRDNLARESIPQPSDAKQGSAEQGLGSESDKLKSSVKGNQPLTYERPQSNQGSAAQVTGDSQQQFNDASEESAGKEDARERQQEQAEQRQIESMKERDQEVRTHEQAHATIGGQYAGSPQYDFQRGPDGQRYAIDGEVSIDVSTENTPQQTIRKMQQVRAAALAPAEPSPQDLQ